MSLENWNKGGTDGQMPFIAPPHVVLHFKKRVWIKGII
jgi:hypothetical protein